MGVKNSKNLTKNDFFGPNLNVDFWQKFRSKKFTCRPVFFEKIGVVQLGVVHFDPKKSCRPDMPPVLVNNFFLFWIKIVGVKKITKNMVKHRALTFEVVSPFRKWRFVRFLGEWVGISHQIVGSNMFKNIINIEIFFVNIKSIGPLFRFCRKKDWLVEAVFVKICFVNFAIADAINFPPIRVATRFRQFFSVLLDKFIGADFNRVIARKCVRLLRTIFRIFFRQKWKIASDAVF